MVEERGGGKTYSYNSRVIGHRGLVFLDARVFLDAKVLHIATTENDVLVHLIRGTNLIFSPTTFCAERTNVLERYCGLVRVDLMEHANVAITR